MAAAADPGNPRATPAENARFAAFAASLERGGLSPITRACYASDWWTVSELAHTATGKRFRLGEFDADAFAEQRTALAAQATSPATLNRRLSFLRRYSAFAAEREPALRETAADFAGLGFLDVPKRTTKALTHGETQRLRAAADALGEQAGAIVALLLGTGLRAAELAELTRADVVGPAATPTSLRIRGPRAKTVLLGPLAQVRLARVLASATRGASAPVLAGDAGAALGEAGVASVVERAAREAGVEATPRTLRHTFAVHYLSEHEGDLDGLAHALGHSGLAAVRAYHAESRAAAAPIQARRWDDLAEDASVPGVRRRAYAGMRTVVERDVIAPGTETPFAAAPAERITIVLAGRVVVSVGTTRVEAGAGELVPIPGGTAHSIAATGDRAATVLHVSARPRRAPGRRAR